MEDKNVSFEKYFLKYKNLIIRVIVDGSGDYQLAQEICQLVYERFYKNMDKVRPGMEKVWLIRCAKNALTDHYRKARVRREIYTEDIPPAEVGNLLVEKSIDRQEERIDQRDLAGKILSEVRKVNVQWYDVLVLHCVEELPHAEAARRLQISETVFRARLCRARAYIRENFGEEYKKLKKMGQPLFGGSPICKRCYLAFTISSIMVTIVFTALLAELLFMALI